MKNSNQKKNKHLTLDDRMKIQSLLNNSKSFRYIASVLSKDPSTISKEVRKHTRIRGNINSIKDVNGNTIQTNKCPLLEKPLMYVMVVAKGILVA